MSGWIPWAVIVVLAGLCALYLRGERTVARRRAAEVVAALVQLGEEVGALRAALVTSGAAERPAQPPPEPPPSTPPPRTLAMERQAATATPAPHDEPPSTKPSESRPVRKPPGSNARTVPFRDQVARAMARIERHARVSPEVQARWEQRLRALGAALGLPEDGEPTDSQLARVVRELYEAEADVKDAGPAAPPPPLEATLASAASPIAVRIAEATIRPGDADGETTLHREGDRPAALPRPNDDDPAEGRDTGEDMTRVFSKQPGAADAQIPGVEVKPLPATVRPPPHRPPRPIADPLAGVELERPTSSATRTAEAFRGRSTLPGGVVPPGDEQDTGGEP
jgi:hypothetical protein